MKFIDLFSGIGGFRLGLEAVGHECVAFCEIDKFARKSYEAEFGMFGQSTAVSQSGNKVEYFSSEKLIETSYLDITKITDEEWRQYAGKVELRGYFFS
jgi:DNA (cytosine-5)-methyltransferase 1